MSQPTVADLAGTSSPDFQIGKRGPRIFSGTADPTVTSPGGPAEANGDLYVRTLTSSESLWQFQNGTWVDLAAGGGGATIEAFSGFHTTAVIDFSETYQDLTIGTEHVKTSNFTHSAGSAVVVANFTGQIEFSGHLTVFAQATSSDRTSFQVRLMRDIGAGFVEILGTEQTGYVREKLSELNSQAAVAITPVILDVTSGDEFKMQFRKEDGTANNGVLDTLANQALISLRSL